MIAVLDWELSSLGHPLADLAHLCMIYLPIPGKLTVGDTPGIPKEESLIHMYTEAAGIPYPINNWPFFKALGCFRIAGIAQVCVRFCTSILLLLLLSLLLLLLLLFISHMMISGNIC